MEDILAAPGGWTKFMTREISLGTKLQEEGVLESLLMEYMIGHVGTKSARELKTQTKIGAQ